MTMPSPQYKHLKRSHRKGFRLAAQFMSLLAPSQAPSVPSTMAGGDPLRVNMASIFNTVFAHYSVYALLFLKSLTTQVHFPNCLQAG